MARHILILLLACLPLKALADCGNLSQKFLNVTLGETSKPREYLNNLPQGWRWRRSADHETRDDGMYWFEGQASGLTMRPAAIIWHGERVIWVHMRFPGADDADIERILKDVLAIAGTDFDPNPKLVPTGEHLRCADGLSARVARGRDSAAGSRDVPVLVVTVEHPKLFLRMQCTANPKFCEGTPKHLYE